MATYQYPTNYKLKSIEQDKLPVLTENRPAFKIMPVEDANTTVLRWEQKDNYTGLMAVRGVGGSPSRVNRVGSKEYIATPGVYGEFIRLDEQELLDRRALGDATGAPIDITDLVTEAQDQLLERRLNIIESIIWTLCSTGTFSAVSGTGQITHTDTFTIATFSGSDWSTAATATPLLDFRNMQVARRGTSNRYDGTATAYMNQVTFVRMINNANAADLGGKLVMQGNTITGLPQFNKILLDNNLPQIVIMDDGYLADGGTFTPFIADDKVVVVATRANGAALGKFVMTRNVNNPNGRPGPYTMVNNKMGQEVPPHIEVHAGFNGGPILEFPGGVCVMSV